MCTLGRQDAFVLCRIFHKSGSGPKNGEKYGAPLIEEEWDEEESIFVPKQEDFTEELPVDMDSFLDANDLAQVYTLFVPQFSSYGLSHLEVLWIISNSDLLCYRLTLYITFCFCFPILKTNDAIYMVTKNMSQEVIVSFSRDCLRFHVGLSTVNLVILDLFSYHKKSRLLERKCMRSLYKVK
jgi:hypothetical protein